MALLKIIQKNFKLLIRSKSSALIIILGPLLVIFLVGIAFDNMDRYSINIGTYSDAYSPLSESFIEKLAAQDFALQKIDSEELCINKIKMGTLHSCIIFPPNLNIESGKINELIFYVDQSKMNLMWMVLDSLSTNVEERSSEVSRDITSNLLQKISEAQTALSNTQPYTTDLKSKNQELIVGFDSVSNNIAQVSSSPDEIKAYIIQKMNDAQSVVSDVKKILNSSNATDSQKNTLSMKISSINTYLYNINNKMQDKDSSESDWTKLTKSIQSLDSQLVPLKESVSQSNIKIDDLV